MEPFRFGEEWDDERKAIDWCPAFVQQYLNMVRDTEPAPIHHLGCVLALLSVAAGGGTFVKYGSKKVRLNLYCGLIAPSGYRKTEAILLAMPLFRAAVATWPEHIRPAVADMTSNTSLVESAGKRSNFVVSVRQNGNAYDYAQIFVAASEFAAFVRAKDRDMIRFLTAVFDGAVTRDSIEYDTQTGGRHSILNPYAVMLVASTLDWLADMVPRSAREGGFLNRFLFFFSDQLEVVPFPQEDEAIKDQFSECLSHYGFVVTNSPAIDWSREAREMFASWYSATRGGMLSEAEADMRSWTSRLGMFIIKLAGLSALADHRTIIEPKDLNFAWAIMHYARIGAQMANQVTGSNPESWLELQVVKYLVEAEEVIPAATLCRRFSSDASAHQVRRILSGLASMGIIQFDTASDRVKAVIPQATTYLKQPEAKAYDLTWAQLPGKEEQDEPFPA